MGIFNAGALPGDNNITLTSALLNIGVTSLMEEVARACILQAKKPKKPRFNLLNILSSKSARRPKTSCSSFAQ